MTWFCSVAKGSLRWLTFAGMAAIAACANKKYSVTDRPLEVRSSYQRWAYYDCPRLNGYVWLSEMIEKGRLYDFPWAIGYNGTAGYPWGGASMGLRFEECATPRAFCIRFADPNVVDVIALPRHITEDRSYVHGGTILRIERSQSPDRGARFHQAIIRLRREGTSTRDAKEITLVVQDRIGVVAIDGLTGMATLGLDRAEAEKGKHLVDFGQCTFRKGRPLFHGVRVNFPPQRDMDATENAYRLSIEQPIPLP